MDIDDDEGDALADEVPAKESEEAPAEEEETAEEDEDCNGRRRTGGRIRRASKQGIVRQEEKKMAIRIDGKAIAAQVRAEVREQVTDLQNQGICPGLAVILVGDDPASRIYVNNKKKACADVGIHSEEFTLPASTSQDELLALVQELNGRADIHGILVAVTAAGWIG